MVLLILYAIFTIILLVLLLVILNVNTSYFYCNTNKNNAIIKEKSCFAEHFETTPTGILYDNNKWCNKVGDICIAADGSVINLNKKIDQNNSLIESGPCLTENNTWGIRLPQYGRKCLSMELINQLSINNTKPPNKSPSGLNNKQTKKESNTLKELRGLSDMGGCKINPKDTKKYTSCYPLTSDFNYLCQVKYGRNYGYKNIHKVGKNMGKAECSMFSNDGIDLYKNTIDCIPTNNIDAHLKQCQLKYGENIHSVKNIDGYNCNVGYYSSECR